MIGKLLHQIAFFGGQVGRREHFEFVHEIARRGLAPPRDAAPLQSHYAAGLTARRNLQRDAAVEGRRRNFRAKCGLVVPDRKLTANVAAGNGKDPIRLEVDGQEQIAVKFGTRTVTALPFQADARALGDARRDSYVQRASRRNDAAAPAFRTRIPAD
jgi:hypothetical protein